MASSKNCTFCGKSQNEVEGLVPSPITESVNICKSCAAGTMAAFEDVEEESNTSDDFNLPKPSEIIAKLDQFVIGQTKAKKVLAGAIYKHYLRKKVNADTPEDLEIQKSNILLTGPSGCGKTQLARTIAKLLNVPFYCGDATKITQAGYVGDDVDSLLQGLLDKAGWNVEKAQWGIIVIDEIDKIARKSGSRGAGYRDVSGEGVQQALLKLIEGGEVTVAKGKGVKMADPNQQSTVTIDTTNILFIGMGSFDGIQEVVNERANKKASVGFGSDHKSSKEMEIKDVYINLTEDDILSFGIIPELAGRLPVLTGVEALNKEEMVRILTEPKDAIIRQEQWIYKQSGVELVFTPEALEAIADKAIQKKTGARALRGIVTHLLLDYDLKVPESNFKKITITAEYVRGDSKTALVETDSVSREVAVVAEVAV